MNQNAILQSNLLDIIFENRNKDYGAYILRKSYNSHIRIALFLMMGISLLFCLLISKQSTPVLNLPNPVITIPDTKVTEYVQQPRPQQKVMVNNVRPKKVSAVELPPKIADSIIINKSAATPIESIQSLKPGDFSGMNVPEGEAGLGKGSGGRLTTASVAPKIVKPAPLETAEIMPQYPGGIKALLTFLKKNLRQPGDIDEGDEVSVKIKFVVNFDGRLESFDVIQSGGGAFDSEVIRVLKKMPSWIPGKSKGENVSVYYIVPVKFRSEY